MAATRRITALTRKVLAGALQIAMTLDQGQVVHRAENALVPEVAAAVLVYRLRDRRLLEPMHVQDGVPHHVVDVGRGGPLAAALTEEGAVQLLHAPDVKALQAVLPPPVVETVARAAGTPCGVAIVALVHDGVPVGVLVAVTSGVEPPDDERVRALETVADVLAAAIAQAEAFALGQAVQGALAEASLLEDVPSVPGYEIASMLDPVTPGSPVGGDWVDVLPLDGRVAFAIGDVVGHGVPAATWMTQLRNALRAYLVEGHPPATCLDLLNRFASVAGHVQPATVLVGELRPDDGRVRFARAGHPPPIVAGRDLAIAETSPDPPIGTLPGHRHFTGELALRPGELLLTYTDGLVERRGVALDDSIADLGREASTWAVERVDDLVQMLRRRVREDVGRVDDMAALVIGRSPDRVDRLVEAVDLDVESVARQRAAVTAWLGERRVEGLVAADVALAISELGANAIAASEDADQFGLAVAVDDQRVTVSVTNAGPPFTLPPDVADPLAPTGRGLRMLRRAADRLEIQHEDGITTVSCVFVRE